ncbi:hypothetical protein FGO68_gene16191 [Halteria grandinella]|uniref:Uncharacterized protein n=1 Tax=Halteria grandinella TaxID=5974 RepID=A0A8J8NBS0_HALGN|nr:hypothetical protein FGO68_gene16191 [Halteria grandinella]
MKELYIKYLYSSLIGIRFQALRLNQGYKFQTKSSLYNQKIKTNYLANETRNLPRPPGPSSNRLHPSKRQQVPRLKEQAARRQSTQRNRPWQLHWLQRYRSPQ